MKHVRQLDAYTAPNGTTTITLTIQLPTYIPFDRAMHVCTQGIDQAMDRLVEDIAGEQQMMQHYYHQQRRAHLDRESVIAEARLPQRRTYLTYTPPDVEARDFDPLPYIEALIAEYERQVSLPCQALPEPRAFLDPAEEAQVAERLRELATDDRSEEHDLLSAIRDRVAMALEAGRRPNRIELGPREQQVLRAFEGELSIFDGCAPLRLLIVPIDREGIGALYAA